MKYLAAFFGSVLYNYLLFVIAKNNCDQTGIEFEYKKYVKLNWDNWGLTLLLAPVLVWYMPDIVALINDKLSANLSVYKIYYLGAGPFTEVVLFAMFKLIGWKTTWIAPVHKD
jgi:hypothetical protein